MTSPDKLSLRDIRLQKLQGEHPELFTVTGFPKLDLRQFQANLHGKQREHRVSGIAQEMRQFQSNKHRLRVRLPSLADCKVIDTRTDGAVSRLYFELGNGQVVRADRATDRQDFNPETGNFKKGRRRASFTNQLIQNIVAAEILKNAERVAA